MVDKNELTELNLNNLSNLTTIGPAAFFQNDLQTIDLTGCTALTTIGKQAFQVNPNLKTIKNGTGNVFNWGDIINCKSGYIFEKGTVKSSYGDIVIE